MSDISVYKFYQHNIDMYSVVIKDGMIKLTNLFFFWKWTHNLEQIRIKTYSTYLFVMNEFLILIVLLKIKISIITQSVW